MILLQWTPPKTQADFYGLIQTAIDLEFSTLPPYLYARLSIPDGENPEACDRLDAIILQEMIHMCLACNILNAVGGMVSIKPPSYPCHLPGDVGGQLIVHLYPFSPAAMEQGKNIETPVNPVNPPDLLTAAAQAGPMTIGEYYAMLDTALQSLPASAWKPNRYQISDAQFFQGQLFPVNSYADAHQAISDIVSEGEGSPTAGSPLDFENELAHFYRFEEIYRNQVLVKANNSVGYAWGQALGVDWSGVYPAISDPETHDFSKDPLAARQAQAECNAAYSTMVNNLVNTFRGQTGLLGNAVRGMFDLRMSALKALNTPLADGKSVAGPAFRYLP